MTRIERFGWRGAVEPGIGRVVSAHGDYYHLVCNEAEGEILARKKKSAFGRMKTAAPDDMKGAKKSELQASEPRKPITGDFVRFRHNAQGDSMILEVLPRFSHFERRENFSTARIDRYLALAEDIGGGEAVVALTKMDLREDGDERFIDELVETIAGRAPLLMISALTGEGMDAVREYAKPGATLAFVGSSGVGKSTLLNALAGEEWAATQEIQEWSGKGRHTTTSRELVMLPSGAMVIDTPGVREIGMVGEVEATRMRGESTHRWRKKES